MYFSNISNPELQHLHNTLGADFSMSVNEILHKAGDVFDNKLFIVEEIISDKLYRVYPQFYCNNIISSNPNDKNLDNRCLILEKTEHETYLSFMTNKSKSNALLNTDYLNIKKIRENLSDDEFNALVYMIRRKGALTANINFEETNNIEGIYGTYTISNDDQLRNDTGFIVNDKIKNNPLAVTLQNPFFLNAHYILKFTVRSLIGANVCIEEYEDYKTVDTFEVDLIEDVPVSLDLSGYTNDSVLDFNVEVEVSFDVPEIVNGKFSLTIASDTQRIALGEEIVLTATLSGQSNVEGYNVQFFEDGNPILDGVRTTDENGVATLKYTPQSAKSYTYSCTTLGMSDYVNVIVFNKNTKCSLQISEEIIRVDNTINLTGTLVDSDDTPLTGKYVDIYRNNILMNTLQTDNNGVFRVTGVMHEVVGDYTYRAEYVGSEGYESATSNFVTVNVYKYPTTLQLSVPSTVYIPGSLIITGNLKKEGNAFANADVGLYINGHSYPGGVTDSNGNFSKTINDITSETTFAVQAEYSGTAKIASALTDTYNVTARKINVDLNLETSGYRNPSTGLMVRVDVSGVLKDEFGNPLTDTEVFVNIRDYGYKTLSTDSNGNYSYSVFKQGDAALYPQVTVRYDGDNTHKAITKTVYVGR